MFSNQALKKLIVPLLIEQLLSVLVGMADIMMVSSVGEAAVSGVALVDLINVLIINIFAALATGGAVVVAQLIGSKDQPRARKAANQLIYITALISLVIMVIILITNRGLLGLLFGKTEAQVMENAVTYFWISALSYPAIALYNAGAALFRSVGNSRISMAVSALMNVLNIIGNAVFVFGFHRGVDGVAASSLLSRYVAAVIVLVLLHRKHYAIYIEKLLHLARLKNDEAHTAIGIPSSLGKQLFSVGPGAFGEYDFRLWHQKSPPMPWQTIWIILEYYLDRPWDWL